MASETVSSLRTAVPEVPKRRGPIRVLVVDDSVVMRQLISRMLGSETGCEVIAFAKNGLDAVAKVEQFKPDLVTLDVEMPELDGLGALKLIKEKSPRTRVIMCSSLTSRGATATVEALILGADDYVAKQRSGEMTQTAFETLRSDLVEKVKALFQLAEREQMSGASGRLKLEVHPSTPSYKMSGLRRVTPKVVVIGVSTGGPSALAELLPAFPANFPLPILIVQHMPPVFTASLAERLTRLSRLPVIEATAEMIVVPGQALLAPGDFHLRLIRRGTSVVTALDRGERENFCRPAVDVLFRSVAEVYCGAAIATVLTGMGQDGLAGARLLRNLGATVFAQDRETSVVWGMPGAIVNAELADAILPLKQIYSSIERRL